MKKLLLVFALVSIFGIVGNVSASLTTIGTATYMGSEYNLIYENDSIDGGLVWLDYTRSYDSWQNQVDWASGLGSNLTVNLYSGYTSDIDWGTDWRLPLTQDQNNNLDDTGSEMGHLYYASLGKPAGGPWGNPSPFDNLQSYYYWSGTEYSPDPDHAWLYLFNYGYQDTIWKDFTYYALAVRPGQVSAVPIPGAVWLLGSGLIGLMGFRRNFSKG